MKKYWLASHMAAFGLFSAHCFAGFAQINLVSDIPGMAAATDANLKNPWGMSFTPTSPFWVSNQGSNKATLYNALASSIVQGLVVTTPTAGLPTGPTGPTGQVFNSTASSFKIPGPSATMVKATFLFDTLDGTIQGWNPASNGGMTSSEIVVTVPNAVFTGLALASASSADYLYAADATGHILVFDSAFSNVSSTTFAGKFVDPNPVAGFTPYNIANLGGNLFVTYAAVGPMGVPLPGGYVDEFDTSGTFIKRVATGGAINTPWGLAIAPAGFGNFGGDLLVGNLYDSVINAYNLTSGNSDGSIKVNSGFASPVGLWALAFGNGTTGFANTLYFTSGINDQKDGLFGAITLTDIFGFVQNPGFAGIQGNCPTNWICSGSPSPGFESYAPTTLQYAAPPFATMALSPTIYGGSGVIRQLTSTTWIGGTTYTLRLAAGLPLTEPDGKTPVVGWPGLPNGAARLYLTMGAGFGQVAAFDIPSPGVAGTVSTVPITFTLPTNSPAVGQAIGVMIYVSAPSGFAANFSLVP
jgi:uncharacterized protein (TIGR03118 family)